MSLRSSSFDWTQYLYVAQELAGVAGQKPTQEAKLRSAVSRAYYAAFIQARNYLRDVEGQQVPVQNAHRYVIRQFIASPDPRHRRIGWDLSRVRDMRTHADYDDAVPNLPKMARRSIARATSIIRRIQNL
jgi:uncharacterized protein (UPF0332 family)